MSELQHIFVQDRKIHYNNVTAKTESYYITVVADFWCGRKFGRIHVQKLDS